MNIVTKCISGSIFLVFCLSFVHASDEDTAAGLQLPDGLSITYKGETRYEHYRTGGRLERLVVYRENGWTEIYQNQRDDALWVAEENQLGERPNVRRWQIGTW